MTRRDVESMRVGGLPADECYEKPVTSEMVNEALRAAAADNRERPLGPRLQLFLCRLCDTEWVSERYLIAHQDRAHREKEHGGEPG